MILTYRGMSLDFLNPRLLMKEYIYHFYAHGKPVSGTIRAADETDAQRKLLEPYIKTPQALFSALSTSLWLFPMTVPSPYPWAYDQADWFNARVAEQVEYAEYLRLKAKFEKTA